MSSNIAHVTEEISAVGFSVHQDAHFGALVDSVINKKFNFYSEEGFSLFRAVLRNDLVSNVIPDVIKAVLPEPVFIFCRVFGRTRQKHSIVNRKDEKSMRILTVWCWSSESKATLYSGSHLHHLNAKDSDNSLLEVSDKALQQDDIQQRPYHIDLGGFAIVDGRCAWQMMNGKGVLFGFAIPDEARHWFPMAFPSTLQSTITNIMAGTDIAIRADYRRVAQPQKHITTTTTTNEKEQVKTTSAGNSDQAHDMASDQGPSESNLDSHEGRIDDISHK
ncbi:hypothetical protein Forpe1208_v010761 [Fusarium oxysporum f. sp. rapae]|uniref:Uncharacterized protein n=1 Tax=Fusarium oxysporum f. sp. rapae TaxID=485398 RepID=A0A8J5NW28_FUSOX|nr:hypothetical protein Forpe1208_v010761 [Fusarium oxysporum f. sp. rapae]